MKETFVYLFLFFGIVLTIGIFAKTVINSNERVECKKWQEYSAQYDGFYLVQWQKDQCDSHKIIINSPVK